MYSSTANIRALMANFHAVGMMLRYSTVIPHHQMKLAQQVHVEAP